MAAIAVIARTTGVANELERKCLKLEAGDVVVRVTRVRSAGDPSVSYELAVLPLKRFPGLTLDDDVENDIVALARAHGLALGRATEELDHVLATTEVAEFLGIDPDDVVVRVDRVVRCAQGLPIEWRVTHAVP